MSELTVTLESVRRRVDARLETFLEDSVRFARERASEAVPLLDEVRALTMRGGKRLRPALVVAAVECVVSWESMAEPVIELACAIELLQTYLLVHDDWMDGDTVRRGGPAVHAALAETYGSAHLGAATGVLAGDLASALAQEFLSSRAIPAERLHEVLRVFCLMQREVVLGQTLDVLESRNTEAMHDLKTGSYTVRGPLALGHALVGGNAEQWASLRAFAGPLGIAFQHRDDLIGTFGDEKETGKSSANDLRAGKRTAVVEAALERLPAVERASLEALLGRSEASAIADARALILASGARTAIEDKITALKERAIEALDPRVLRPEGVALLAGLAAILTERKK